MTSIEHLVNSYQITSVNPQAKTGETRDCTDPWRQPYVLEDGSVWPCCWFYGGSIGNIQKQNFRDIWDGDEVKQLRRQLLTGDLAPQCRDCPCRSKTTPEALLAKVRAIPRLSQGQ
jgi:radical SAM protein with 4Fe4S-binding SPASM domain